MKERKNRSKKIRGVKKVSWFLGFVCCFLDYWWFASNVFCLFHLLCRRRLQMLPRVERRNKYSGILRVGFQQWTLFNSSIFLLGSLEMKSFVVSIGVFWCFVILSDFEYLKTTILSFLVKHFQKCPIIELWILPSII